VARLGGANELVVGDAELFVHLAEDGRVAVGKLLRRDAFGLGVLLHLQAVLVGAGQEEHILAVQPLEARQDVGGDDVVGVADMRLAVGVEDRRGDVEFFA